MVQFKRITILIAALIWIVQPALATVTHHHPHAKAHHHAPVHHKHLTHKKSRQHHRVHQEAPIQVGENGFIPTTECRDPSLLDAPQSNSSFWNLSRSNEKLVANFVDKTVSHLRYSSYKLGGKRFDSNRGVYVLDCSSFVDHVLQEASPNAYSSLVNATGADTPASQHYYDFFRELSSDSDSYWSKVSSVEDLRAGDILVFRYKNRRGIQTGGHVMVVMNKPIQDNDVYLVRVADSAPTRHSEDTRSSNSSGVGIGTLVLKANSKTGQPSAYAWGLDSYWNKNVNIAMARPVDVG